MLRGKILLVLSMFAVAVHGFAAGLLADDEKDARARLSNAAFTFRAWACRWPMKGS